VIFLRSIILNPFLNSFRITKGLFSSREVFDLCFKVFVLVVPSFVAVLRWVFDPVFCPLIFFIGELDYGF
jgi:hypothetical protein